MRLIIGSVLGGPELGGSAFDLKLRKLMRLAERYGSDVHEGYGLNVLFYLSGSIWQVDFDGIRRGKIDRKKEMIELKVAVPDETEAANFEGFMVDALRKGAEMASSVLGEKGLPFDADEFVHALKEIELGLSREG